MQKSSSKKKKKAQSFRNTGMRLYCVKHGKPNDWVHTVIVDDGCEDYKSSPYESRNLEEDDLEHFGEHAFNKYKEVLG